MQEVSKQFKRCPFTGLNNFHTHNSCLTTLAFYLFLAHNFMHTKHITTLMVDTAGTQTVKFQKYWASLSGGLKYFRVGLYLWGWGLGGGGGIFSDYENVCKRYYV